MQLKLSNAKFRGGFTLMELVVVVVIIGIMTALIIPEMSGTFQAALLRSTGREIVNVFSLANSHAVNLHRSCRVRLDSKTGRYLVERKVNKEGQVNFVPLAVVNVIAPRRMNWLMK